MDNTLALRNSQKSNYDLQTHLSDYLAVIFKHKWIVLGCFLCIVGNASVYSIFSTPIFQASAQIMIREQPSPLNPLGENTTRSYFQNEYFQTQVNLLSNRSLVWEVIEKLGLKKVIEEEFGKQELSNQAEASPAKVKTVTSAEDSGVKTDDLIQDPRFINWYLQHLEVSRVPDSNLVNVHFKGTDPELITKIVNAHAQTAIERNVRIQKAHAHDALNWLKSQIGNQKKEVEDAQKKIHVYQKENDLITVKDRQNLISLELDQVNVDLIEARNTRIAKQAAYDQLQKVLSGREEILTLPEITNDSVLLNLRNRLVELKAGKIEMATKFGPKHPKMIQISLGINQLNNEIKVEIERLKKTIQADLNRALSIEAELLTTLNEKKAAAIALGEKAIEYDVLSRQADSSDEVYDFLLKQSEEINLSSVMDTSGIQIVDSAEVPRRPVKPNHMVNIGMAILVGFLFSTGLAFFIEYMDNTIKDPYDVSTRLGLSVLGMIPFDRRLKKNIALALPWNETSALRKRSSDNSSYYPVSNRFPLLFDAFEDNPLGRVVTVESATMEEGKTTIAIKAAQSMAAAGMRVLMVDGDLVRPMLSRTFRFQNGRGLAYFLKKIQNYQITTGDLSTCSLDDLFFLIAFKKKNGRLIVKNNDGQTMEIFFQNGGMVHLQYPDNPDANRLGTMLANSGLISTEQMQDALSRNERTGQPLGYILVNAGYLTREKLQGPLRLQMEENLQKLFSWKNGNYEFISGSVDMLKGEKISFSEEYSETVKMLGKLEGSRLIEEELFAQIASVDAENLFILPAGAGPANSDAVINPILMKKVLEILRQHFNVIVIDTSPIDAQAETTTLSALADDIVFVIKAGKLSHKVINQAKSSLPQEKIVGAILNQVKHQGSSYYHNYYHKN